MHEIHHDALAHHQVRLLVKRDDLIHPAIPGNKWRKLTPNLEAARRAGHDIILTFGGAYSNHIYAAASAGRLFGFRFIDDFTERHEIFLDHVYTGKMMYGLFDLISRASFAPGTTIVAVHTGGVDASRPLTLDPVADGEQG